MLKPRPPYHSADPVDWNMYIDLKQDQPSDSDSDNDIKYAIYFATRVRDSLVRAPKLIPILYLNTVPSRARMLHNFKYAFPLFPHLTAPNPLDNVSEHFVSSFFSSQALDLDVELLDAKRGAFLSFAPMTWIRPEWVRSQTRDYWPEHIHRYIETSHLAARVGSHQQRRTLIRQLEDPDGPAVDLLFERMSTTPFELERFPLNHTAWQATYGSTTPDNSNWMKVCQNFCSMHAAPLDPVMTKFRVSEGFRRSQRYA